MHTLYTVAKPLYSNSMHEIVQSSDKKHQRPCYISFNSPHEVVVRFLQKADISHSKFMVVDATKEKGYKKQINAQTIVIPTEHVFDIYMFLRDLLTKEGVDHLILDSVSALIYKQPDRPLSSMLSDFLLEAGARQCESSVVIFPEHQNHHVVSALTPFFARLVSKNDFST